MDRLDKLLKGPDLITSDQATGPILDSISLLERDVWQEAFDRFDIFADAESHAGLPVEQGMKYVVTKWFRERPWGW